jgi:hypothetical protein
MNSDGGGRNSEGLAEPYAADAVAEGKPWWQSRTILGAVVVVISTVASMVGWSVDAGEVTELAVQGAALVGAGLAIYGRVRARRPIRRVRRAGR